MTIIVFALVGGVLGLVAGGSVGIMTGGALGALAGWCALLAGRLRLLEQRLEVERAASRPSRAAEPPAEPAARGAAREPKPPAETFESPPPPAPQAARGEASPAAREPEPAARWRAPAVPAAPRAPQESALDRAIAGVWRYFTTGNVPVKVGVVLSVFGVGFLVKEGIDRHWLALPLELRLALVAAFGIVLLGIGWRLRERQPTYALSVQGGGIAVLYVTTYASFALYHLLPASITFAALVVVTAAAGVLAVLQDSRSLAVLGIVGGFLAPVLASTGAGNHVALFSYYALLNAAIVAIAWFKAWRVLNVLGFVFTFGIGTLWGIDGYEAAKFASTEPFLVLFTLTYILIPVLFATRTSPQLRGFVDGTLVFGTPIVAFGLQSRLVADTEYGLALSAVALAAVYVALATTLYRRWRETLRVLIEAQLALGVVFATVAVPLALDARWTSGAWALEGAALVWLGFRQQRKLPLLAGLVLQGLSAGAYAEQGFSPSVWPVVNGHFLGGLLLALAGAISGRLFDPRRARPAPAPIPSVLRTVLSVALLLWAGGWWFATGATEIERFVTDAGVAAELTFFAASAVGLVVLAERVDWPRLAWLAVALWPAASIAALVAVVDGHPARDLGWAAWPCVTLAMFAVLKLREQAFAAVRGALHALAYWVPTALLATETHWLVRRVATGVWPEAAALAVGAVVALLTLGWRERVAWPLAAHARTYVQACCGGLVAALVVATLALNLGSPGSAAPLPYVPVLNPLDLASLLVLFAVLAWLKALEDVGGALAPLVERRAAIAAAFVWFLMTMGVARTVHHWTGVPFDLDRLAASTTLQSALSIVWGLAGLAGMIAGARTRRRAAWLAGAGLMGVVVAKLFLVDLGNTGTLARVVSFLGVGLLLLVVGYFAPVPPREPEDNAVGQQGSRA